MSTGDVLTKHTLDSATRPDMVEVRVPVISENGTNDTYVTKLCVEGLMASDNNMDVDTLDFFIHVPVMLVLIFAGFFGNALITYVLWRQDKRTLTGGLFTMVSLTDNFVLLFYLLYFTIPTMYEYTRTFQDYYIFYASVKIYIWFGYVTSRTMSTYAVVLLVGNRYLSVACTKSLAYLRKITYAKLGISLIIAFAILVNFPQILLFESNPYFDPCHSMWMPKIDKAGLLHRKSFIIAYQLCFHVFFMFALPALILAFCLLRLQPYVKRKCPTADVEVPLEQTSDKTSDECVVSYQNPDGLTPESNEFEMKELDCTSDSMAAETSGLNSGTPDDDFSDGDVESPNIVNERIVAVIYGFLLLHTPAIVLYVIIIGKRMSGPTMGTGDKSSMVLSEFHELILASFSAIKFYLYIFIGKRYWRALEKTLKVCHHIKRKSSEKKSSASTKENNNRHAR